MNRRTFLCELTLGTLSLPLAAEPRLCGSCLPTISPRPLHSRLAGLFRSPCRPPLGRVAFALLIAVVTSGCANYSFNEVRRPVTGTELPRAEAERSVSSRSDRLRGGWPIAETPTPASPPETVRMKERTQPQEPTRPSEAAPPQGTDEPDPRAVIDWLLKRDRR